MQKTKLNKHVQFGSVGDGRKQATAKCIDQEDRKCIMNGKGIDEEGAQRDLMDICDAHSLRTLPWDEDGELT